MDAALLAVGFVARLSGFVVDRRIDDVVEHEVFLDLLDFGGRAALLRVQSAIA